MKKTMKIDKSKVKMMSGKKLGSMVTKNSKGKKTMPVKGKKVPAAMAMKMNMNMKKGKKC